MNKKLLKPLIIGTLTGLVIAGSYPATAVEAERQLSLNANSLESLFVDSGAGSLEIVGEKGLKEILVDAKITVDGIDDDEANKWFKKYMKLSLTEKRGKATLKATFENNNSVFSWGGWNGDRTIDLVVRMPANLNLKVDDGSGSATVENLNAKLDFDDGSGNLTIRNIKGDVWVDDGSGTLIIEDITGNLGVDDGSGKLIINKVTGEVEIEDGSGSIQIDNIGKKVYIDDGSGSIKACDINGDLTVDDGSGDVDTCNIKGEVVIK